jgi:apolipoprotein N-acyltransferase
MSEVKCSKNWWFSTCLIFPFVVFVVAGCIVYVLAVVVSFIVVFLCNVRSRKLRLTTVGDPRR